MLSTGCIYAVCLEIRQGNGPRAVSTLMAPAGQGLYSRHVREPVDLWGYSGPCHPEYLDVRITGFAYSLWFMHLDYEYLWI